MLKSNELFVTIDYIENIKAIYARNTISLFRNPAQVAFCEIYQTRFENNELKRLSHCYMSGDPSHDWSMSLFIIKNYITYMKNKYTSNNIQLKRIFWSDRSPKEFSCIAFLQGWNEISRELSIESWWSFGASNHNKFVHDGLGGTVKTAINHGVATGTIVYDNQTPCEITIVNYLRDKMTNPNINNHDNSNVNNNNNNETQNTGDIKLKSITS